MSNYSKDEAIKELQKKLEIEKAKFDKFVEDLKCGIYGKLNGNYPDNNLELYQWLEEIIDELSSKEGEDE
jgi:hypothetical protein